MDDLNQLFRKRIGLEKEEKITFCMLNEVLEKTAFNIPFENLCVISNITNTINKENLVRKILKKNEGGLCYELNAVLYLFLLENGLNVDLVTGAVYDQVSQNWSRTGRTHVTILLRYEMETYLLDTGFGANLPLIPVPLNGSQVTSRNGDFRILKIESDYGDYILEMKLKHKDEEWKTAYAFDSGHPVKELGELDIIQEIIASHSFSSFNKNPLITRLTREGSMTLTNSAFTRRLNGETEKESVDDRRFKELLHLHFGLKSR